MARPGSGIPSVLFVSEARDRHTAIHALRSSGYDVVDSPFATASHVVVATQLNLIVIDMASGRFSSGIELIRRLRNDADTVAIPIVALTIASRPQDHDIAIKAGADLVVDTPVVTASLESAVARLLSARPSRVAAAAAVPVRACPRCGGIIARRDRWPVLLTEMGLPPDNDRHQRMRYAAGWFCTDPACGYGELL